MASYNPDFIQIPTTLGEALTMPTEELRQLLDDPETAPYIMMLALPSNSEWFDSDSHLGGEAELSGRIAGV